MKDHPPKLAFRFLAWFCPSSLYESIEGDLLEQFDEDVKLVGEKKANRKLVWNTLKFFRPGILLRNRFSVGLNSGYMIISNLRFTVRHLLRQKVNSGLHVIGLTLGMSVFLLIGLFVHYESSFDSYHTKADRIYRVNSSFLDGGIKIDLYATPTPLAETIRREVTGIEKVSLTRAHFKTVVEINPQKLFKQEHVLVVEPEFLDVFDIDVLQGDARKALATPYQALLTESIAEKFYGKEDPIGKTFKYKSKFIITVAGVIRDMPPNTNLPSSMLISYVDNAEFLDNGDMWYFGDFAWTKISASTYIVLNENINPKDVERQLQKIANKNINSAPSLNKKIKANFEIQPLQKIHFDKDRFGGGPWVRAISRSWLWFFIGIGVIVLVLACINFLNLSTAQAFTRGKEIGIRKSIGAQRSQVIIQFLGEAGILVFISALLAIAIAYVSLHAVNNLLEKGITLQPLQSPVTIAVLFAGLLLTILFAGIYPAWVIAKFNPVVTLKSNSTGGGVQGSSLLRKILVVTQFVVSSVLFIAVLLIAQQARYVHDKDLGFEKDNIINVEILNAKKAQEFANGLQQIASVKDASLSRSSPISDDHWWNMISQTENGESQPVCAIYGDDRFYSFYGLQLLSGRIPQQAEYVPDSLRDSQYVNKVVVNEELLRKLALGSPMDAIGKHFWWGIDTEIIGVVKDFNTEPLSYGISSTLITQDPIVYAQANIKIEKGSNLAETMAAIELAWKRSFPEGVFEIKFLDSQIDNFYKLEMKLYTLFKIFAALAISISCLGLWGLVAFTAQQRTKEIGIRKVLGASVNAIVMLLSKDFLVIVSIAFAIATPLSYYLMKELLSNFAYHVDISWQVFVFTGMILLLITMLTISFQIIRAALTSPVESLKSE